VWFSLPLPALGGFGLDLAISSILLEVTILDPFSFTFFYFAKSFTRYQLTWHIICIFAQMQIVLLLFPCFQKVQLSSFLFFVFYHIFSVCFCLEVEGYGSVSANSCPVPSSR